MSKNVVIIGGGLSSKHAAELLVKDQTLKVTIVQANKFVEWPLAMTEALVRPAIHDKVLAPNPASFQVPGVDYKYEVAKDVDPVGKKIIFRSNECLPFDALIVATGFKMPIVYPELGQTLKDRKEQVQKVAETIKNASTVVVGGGGPVGLEMAGDIRTEYADKKVKLLCRSNILSQWPDSHRAKVEKQLKVMNIEVVAGGDAPLEYKDQPGSISAGGQDIAYDVYIPAFSQGPNTQFLLGVSGLLDDKGFIIVNEFLQSSTHKGIFTVGSGNNKEPIMMPKLEAQWISVANNVKSLLQGKPMKAHKEGMPVMKLQPAILLGHGSKGWGIIDFDNVPGPVKCCCCCGLGGFPCCPPPCCWPCCPGCPCLCGYCCGPSEGNGFAKFSGAMAVKSMGFHFKGGGEAPAQEVMQ